MKTKNLIPATDFCVSHGIELSYISSLQQFGLIEIIKIQETTYIHTEELPKLEKIILFHRELEINLEGVEVIIHLLERVHQIQDEMNLLKNKLNLYQKL